MEILKANKWYPYSLMKSDLENPDSGITLESILELKRVS